MDIEFDPEKDAINIAKHGISLREVSQFQPHYVEEDIRFDYGECRLRAFGLIRGRPYCLAYMDKDGIIRAISLRPAHAKEYYRYVK